MFLRLISFGRTFLYYYLYIFIIIGGFTICHKIRRYFLKLPPSEPYWLQALFRACDYDFVWDVTRGKPGTASSEGMEGQNEIEANKIWGWTLRQCLEN